MNREIKARRRLNMLLSERKYVSFRLEEVRSLKRAVHKVERRLGRLEIAWALAE
ncbi:hypothetical protein Mesil_3555 (plasmid) [Allomeiothermus silvanus DSM 9946]|jgi:ubiquinone biosynthesis protein UbiJ|uniref:Uncharacterized protein n=1 Tax=Allomeiothermus silvanus (strain ATCC 700542 / DSM 9946 / NBRC 106475 / NCIMB 13440 / VI-R2) TaxID=526227 RepID=D7BJJ2_ALLS1|nr:hypothetical protein [Allomeiothermus silvanus]ADH65348.1 hypothetical protein Mesil_3555 [Allomeiothermus silvanus DSM 9946]